MGTPVLICTVQKIRKKPSKLQSLQCWALNAVRELRTEWESCSLGLLVPERLHSQPWAPNCSSPIPSAEPSSGWFWALSELDLSSPAVCSACSELGNSCVVPPSILLCGKHRQLTHHQRGNSPETSKLCRDKLRAVTSFQACPRGCKDQSLHR